MEELSLNNLLGKGLREKQAFWKLEAPTKTDVSGLDIPGNGSRAQRSSNENETKYALHLS